MSTLEDFSKLSEPVQDYKIGKETLLAKYDIPIQHFEFNYVKSCSDDKELERILLVLRSGEEGYYPDLIRAVEERLVEVKPKSKLLRKAVSVIDKRDLNQSEMKEINEDLKSFLEGATKCDKELTMKKTNTVDTNIEIRKYKVKSDTKTVTDKEKPLSSTDYQAWDKYDPDTELMKMELEEEYEKKKTLMTSTSDKKKHKKTVTFNSFATETEAHFLSDRERELGNECFRTGEYEDALQYYTNSIQYKSNVHNLNNRAATYLKLSMYQDALVDCDSVFSLDPDNVKANLRKAQALDGLQRYNEALECIEMVILMEPNNFVAQEMAERLRERCSDNSGEVRNTRMKIVEIE